MALPPSSSSAYPQRLPGPELRLLDRRAFVGFPPLTLAPGIVISDFALQIPDVTFPFSLSGGPSRYQRRKLDFGLLELTLSAEVVARQVAAIEPQLAELESLKLHFRPGYIEGQCRLKQGERSPVTFKIAFDGDGEQLAVYFYDVRLYSFSAVPAPQISVLLSQAFESLKLLPEVELRGASGFSVRILPTLGRIAAVSRGYKIPSFHQARLSSVEVSATGLKLRFASGGVPPASLPDDALLLALEGARAFAHPEALLARGQWAEAREAYLKFGDIREAHPFAAERLLTLLAADPAAHDFALDVAASLARRREASPVPIWVEAMVREHRGEHARAAERYLALCSLSRRNHEDAAAFFAAEAAARVSREQAPQMAVKALHELLGLRPDHLPALQQLARASNLSKDRAGALRAYRRIAALTRDTLEAAEAHVQMARLAAQTEEDWAGARLHCEAALRLAPDHLEALYLMGELCFRSQEHLRALKALDRLRDLALSRHELERLGRVHLLAGKVWEEGLNQLENALLRYKEAASFLPGEPEPLYAAARVAEKLGRIQESIAGYLQAIELAGPTPVQEEVRTAAHQAHHAMARLFRSHLADTLKSREHLEKALSLRPQDKSALDELIPYYRASGRARDLAEALERKIQLSETTESKAPLSAEAGELYRNRLAQPEKAERLFREAVEADPLYRKAWEGLLSIGEANRDAGLLIRSLKALAELADTPGGKTDYLRRLAVVGRDVAFDLDESVRALTEVLRLEPDDLAAVGELCLLQRKRSDLPGLALALAQRARMAETHLDLRLAAVTLRELGVLLDGRLGRSAEAWDTLSRAISITGESVKPDPGLLLEFADLSMRCDKPAVARHALELAMVELYPLASDEKKAHLHVRLAEAADALGDQATARDNWSKAFNLRPDLPEIARHLERVYQEEGDLEKLAQLWSARARTVTGQAAADLWMESAKAFLQKGLLDNAAEQFQNALQASPTGPHTASALEQFADVQQRQGKFNAAADLIARRALLSPNERERARFYWQASVWSEQSDAVEARDGVDGETLWLQKSIESDGTFAPARLRHAEKLSASSLTGSGSSCLDDWDAVLQLPESDPDAPNAQVRFSLLRRAAKSALDLGQFDRACGYLERCCAAHPEDWAARRDLLTVHRAQNKSEPVWEDFQILWPQLNESEKACWAEEFAKLSIALGHHENAFGLLRGLRSVWSQQQLLNLLPENADPERLDILTALLASPETSSSDRPLLLERRSRIHEHQGRLEEALADAAQAAALSPAPRDWVLWKEAARLAQSTGKTEIEFDAWQHALTIQPLTAQDAMASSRLLSLGVAFSEQGFYTPALKALRITAENSLSEEEQGDAWAAIARTSLALSQSPEALDAWWKASRVGPRASRIDALRLRAEHAEALGQQSVVVETLRAALILSPADPELFSGLKGALIRIQDWAGLAEVLSAQTSVCSKAEAAQLFEDLGLLYSERLSRLTDAEAAFAQSIRLNRENLNARTRLIDLLFNKPDIAAAVSLLEETAPLLSPSPGNTAGTEALYRGMSRAQKGQPELALRLFRLANAKVPATGECLRVGVELLYLKGAVQEALPLAERLVDAADWGKDSAGADWADEDFLRLADLAERAGNHPLSEKALRRLIALRPLNRPGVERLSTLLRVRDPQASLNVMADHARLLSALPSTVQLLVSLADRASAELGDLETAASLLNQAAGMSAALSQDSNDILRRLASLYRTTGKAAELRAVLEKLAETEHPVFEELVSLALEAGDLGAALNGMGRLRTISQNQGNLEAAAEWERRRAQLFWEKQQEGELAQNALEESFRLFPAPETAQLGLEWAGQRQLPSQQIQWLERCLPWWDGPKKRDASLQLADLFEEGLGRPEQAVAVLLAARSSAPDDLELTLQTADLLHRIGREDDAAELDALLVLAPTAHPYILERHAGYLENSGDRQSLALLNLRRAEAEAQSGTDLEGVRTCQYYLKAADVFHSIGATEQALLCEEQAFEQSPQNADAFQRMHRFESNPRHWASVLKRRSEALPEEAPALLRQRATGLQAAGESNEAALAWDDYLRLAPNNSDALQARAELAIESGGAIAAQPYYRRLWNVAGEGLPLPLQLKILFNLGEAAMVTAAYQDAADAFEAVVAKDSSGEKGQEALALLAEVYSRTQNLPRLYQACLRRARVSVPAETEAWYRRAVTLFEDPLEALDAWTALAQLRPSDEAVVDKTLRGLLAANRWVEMIELYQRSGLAVGGEKGFEWLSQAAALASTQLGDDPKSKNLRWQAIELCPDHPDALALVCALAITPEYAARCAPRLQSSLKNEPQNAVLWNLLSQALALAGNFSESLVAEQWSTVWSVSGPWSEGAQTARAPPLKIQPFDVLAAQARWSPAAVSPLDASLQEINETTLPHLHGLLKSLLGSHLRPYLALDGGTEVYLNSPDSLVIGAGALNVFGPVELSFACAVAVRWGPASRILAGLDSVTTREFERAALDALKLVPSPVAATHVLVHWDDAVRHADPLIWDPREVLMRNSALLSLAQADVA